MTIPRTVAAFAALLLLLGIAGGCAGDDRTTLERIQEDGVIRVGFAGESPYAYEDTETGRLTGEAPEIARTILEQMGVTEIEPVLSDFGQLIPGLQSGRFDLIAAGMYITPERAERIAFSRPTYKVEEAIMVEAGNPMDLHSYEDIREHDSARIAVVGGAVEEGYARDSGIPAERIEVFPDAQKAVAALRAGRVDAYAGTALTVDDFLRSLDDPDLEKADPFEPPVEPNYGAFGFRPADEDLLAEFNRRLEAFIGTDEHTELVRPFGFTDDYMPGDITAEEVLDRQQD